MVKCIQKQMKKFTKKFIEICYTNEGFSYILSKGHANDPISLGSDLKTRYSQSNSRNILGPINLWNASLS